MNKCTGKRKEDEDIELKAAVQKHGDKDWAAIVSLVQGRTRKQCWNRWKYMDPNCKTVKGERSRQSQDGLGAGSSLPLTHDEFMA